MSRPAQSAGVIERVVTHDYALSPEQIAARRHAPADALRPATIRIEQAQDRQYYLRLIAGNGETVLVSETYTRRRDAVRASKALAGLMPTAVLQAAKRGPRLKGAP